MSARPYMSATPYERFCAMVGGLLPYRNAEPSHALYDQLKRQFIRDVPGCTPEQYQRAIALIAKATGV